MKKIERGVGIESDKRGDLFHDGLYIVRSEI